jgi:regulator of sigma E protease
MSHLVISAAIKMVSGAISPDSVSGPIAIARGAGESAAVGAVFFLSFLAAISVNLGILNLLPIPVLDGGQLLFMAYEAVSGRPPGPRVQYALTVLGFSILLGLMMLAVFNDIRGL